MKDKFDDILKRKFDQHEFPVDQNHRNDMINLLDRQPKRRLLPFWWAGGMALLIVVAGVYFMMTPAGDYTRLSNTEKKSEQNIHEDQSVLAETTILQDVDSYPGVPSSQTPSSDDTDQHLGEVESKTLKTNVADPHVTTAPSSGQQSKSDQKPKAIAILKNDPSRNPFIQKTESLTLSETHTANTAKGHRVEVNEEINPSVPVVVASQAQLSAVNPARMYTSVDPIDPLVVEPLSYATGLTVSNIEPASKQIKPFFIFGEAGSGVIFAAKSKHEAGWKLSVGAGLGYRISPSVSLSLSGGYLFQNGGFSFQRESVVNQPGFGTRSSFNSLSPDKLHYVYSKFGARVSAHRHVMTAHVGVQYLYGAQGDITTFVEDQFAQGRMEFNRYTWLKTNGLRDFLWSADLAYGYQFTPRWSLSAGAAYYFSSLTKDDPALTEEGYTWRGNFSPLQPFIKINYLIYGSF